MCQTSLMESSFVLSDPKEFANNIYSSVKTSLKISSDAIEDEEIKADEVEEVETPKEANEGADTEPSIAIVSVFKFGTVCSCSLPVSPDFIGGSHNSMITLENRVRGLERVVEDMAQDLAGSSGRRPTTFMNTFLSFDSYSYDAPRNGHMGSSKRDLVDVRSPMLENDGNQFLQLVDLVMGNGPNILGIPTEIKNELLLNLNEASLAMDTPEEWEEATPDQFLDQLASGWGIDLQHFENEKSLDEGGWHELVINGHIEYVDTEEEETTIYNL
ncbi:hypothetical protein GIB67_003869, partial [Kingdonia uniflora]